MSWSNLSNIGFSNGNYFTYGGYGQFVPRVNPTQEFLRRLQLPNAKTNILATIQVGWRLAGGGGLGLGLGIFPLPGAFPVITVRVNGGSDLPTPPLTSGFSTTYGYLVGRTAAGVGTLDLYYIDDWLTNLNNYVAYLGIYASLAPKTLRGIDWSPRLRSIPNLSLRVEETFGGLFQVGGGSLALANHDGLYDSLLDAAWDTGTVTLEYGLDLPDSEMAATDYLTLGTWRIEKADLADADMVLSLKELKTRIDTQIPLDLYSREEFPALPNDTVGQPIPFAYGRIFAAKAISIDSAARKFKVAAHRISGFDAVRIKKTLTDAGDVTVTAWTLHSGAAYLSNFTDTVVNVTFNVTELTKKDSIAAVIATAGTFHQEGDYLYVRPPGGETINSGTWTIRREQSFDAWIPSTFATKDLARAEFTLGEDWDRSSEVACDFSGRVKSDGDLMENWTDICADFLDYLGEHIFDAQSFNQSRRELLTGLDRFGREVCQLAPSFYIDKAQAAREVLQEICKVAGATLYVDPSGAWRFEVFRPKMSADLGNAELRPQLTWPHTDLLDARTQTDDSKAVFSRVLLHFAKRHAEDWDETIDENRILNQALHGLNVDSPEEREAPVALGADAQYLAQRLLTTEGPPIRTYRTTLPRPSLLLNPGDQLRFTAARPGGFDRIMELLAIEKDFIAGRSRVTLGDRRGWSDTFGWWLIEDIVTATLPTGAYSHLRAEGLPYTTGQRISTWNNNFIVAPTGVNGITYIELEQPIFRANRINSLPAAEFTGYTLSINNATGINIGDVPASVAFPTNAAEMFLVLKATADPGTTNVNSLHNGFGSTIVSSPEYPAADGTIKETFGLSALLATGVDPAPSLTEWRLYNISINAAAYTIRLDGAVLYTTGAHTVSFFTQFFPTIGYGVANPYAFIGEIAEILIYPRVLTAGERTDVENYFATRFGLPFGTPGNTPVQWNNAWTDAQANYARQNYGWWHGSVFKTANLTTSPNDPRAFEASRWW